MYKGNQKIGVQMSDFILIKILDKIGDPRVRNILIALFDMLLFLLVFFLGMFAVYQTNLQVKEYCINYNMLPHNQTDWNKVNLTNGTPIINITGV